MNYNILYCKYYYSKIKYIPRLLESADTMASGAISGVTQFRAATKEINKYFPELSAAEKSQKVYDIMYSGDIAAETTKAIRDLKNSSLLDSVNQPQVFDRCESEERCQRSRSGDAWKMHVLPIHSMVLTYSRAKVFRCFSKCDK